jgi:hypothetical protein
VADFQAVAARIFEKGGVVSFILPTRAFEVPSAGTGGDEREPVEFGGVLHPECDPAFIRYVAGGFRHSKKGCGSTVWGFGFVLQPAGNLRLPCEFQGLAAAIRKTSGLPRGYVREDRCGRKGEAWPLSDFTLVPVRWHGDSSRQLAAFFGEDTF